MNAFVPDFAIVPKLLISSFLVMTMPDAALVSVELVLSGVLLTKQLGCTSILSRSVMGFLAVDDLLNHIHDALGDAVDCLLNA